MLNIYLVEGAKGLFILGCMLVLLAFVGAIG